MTEAALMAAVPGQSLTDYPKNYPWERPPEITDPNDAIKFHIDRIADEDVIDNVLDLLEFGIPAKTLSESIMTAAVGSGIHSIDVSLIIEPIVRDFMMKAADMAGVNYKETFKPDEMTMAERASLFDEAVASESKKVKKLWHIRLVARSASGILFKRNSCLIERFSGIVCPG